MREHFDDEIRIVSDHMVEMTRLVRSAMARATTSLVDADLALAESVIAADEQVNRLQAEVEELAFRLLATQQPLVATDLRVVFTALRMTADLERMGDLARHVAKLTRLRHPRSAVPVELRGTILEMGQVAERLVTEVGTVITTRDLTLAEQMETDDDLMDDLHRSLFTTLLAPAWPHGVEAAVDITLCSRYYERFADHAVSVARRVVFLVTGERDQHDGRPAQDTADG